MRSRGSGVDVSNSGGMISHCPEISTNRDTALFDVVIILSTHFAHWFSFCLEFTSHNVFDASAVQ